VRGSAVKTLIAANVAVFIVQYLSGDSIGQLFALYPLQPDEFGRSYFHLWQLVTYAFLHDVTNPFHLLFNMYGVWMFGTAIERHVGPARLLSLYFASVLSAAVCQLIVPSLLGSPLAPVEGASGGVFGLLLAFAILFPQQRLMLLIPPVPMPAWLFATLYALIELYLGISGRQAQVAHFAHLGGMVGSALMILNWRRRAMR
jgi:membrane associated rhomboid family serine protease